MRWIARFDEGCGSQVIVHAMLCHPVELLINLEVGMNELSILLLGQRQDSK